MGSGLLRQWILSERRIGQEEIAGIKVRTNAIEDEWRGEDSEDEAGGRRVNIDPGYVTWTKVALATTKDYAHRLYLGSGIYAEVTLTWRNRGGSGRGFEPWPWTYPDYRERAALEFFDAVRGELRRSP